MRTPPTPQYYVHHLISHLPSQQALTNEDSPQLPTNHCGRASLLAAAPRASVHSREKLALPLHHILHSATYSTRTSADKIKRARACITCSSLFAYRKHVTYPVSTYSILQHSSTALRTRALAASIHPHTTPPNNLLETSTARVSSNHTLAPLATMRASKQAGPR